MHSQISLWTACNHNSKKVVDNSRDCKSDPTCINMHNLVTLLTWRSHRRNTMVNAFFCLFIRQCQNPHLMRVAITLCILYNALCHRLNNGLMNLMFLFMMLLFTNCTLNISYCQCMKNSVKPLSKSLLNRLSLCQSLQHFVKHHFLHASNFMSYASLRSYSLLMHCCLVEGTHILSGAV